MTGIERAEQFGVGGAAGVIVCLLYTTIAKIDGISAGDWLGFFGVFVGGALAVGAGMAVERAKAAQQQVADLRALHRAFDSIISGFSGFSTSSFLAEEPLWREWCRASSDGILLLELWVRRASLDDIGLWADIINFQAVLPDSTTNLRRYLKNAANNVDATTPSFIDVDNCTRLANRHLNDAIALRSRL